MGPSLAVGLIAITSVLGYVYGRRALGLSSRGLAAAWKMTLECVGLGVVFFALNMLIAFTGILGLRVAVGRFVTLYAAADVTILVLSFLQGICFWLWRRYPRLEERV